MPLLAGVARAMEATPGSALGSLNYAERAGELRLTVTAPDFAAVESLRGQLETGGLAAVMESSNAQGEQVRARLRVGGV
jgi:type II secretory pathway component PulL